MWGEPDGGQTQEVYVCVEYENIQPFYPYGRDYSKLL